MRTYRIDPKPTDTAPHGVMVRYMVADEAWGKWFADADLASAWIVGVQAHDAAMDAAQARIDAMMAGCRERAASVDVAAVRDRFRSSKWQYKIGKAQPCGNYATARAAVAAGREAVAHDLYCKLPRNGERV